MGMCRELVMHSSGRRCGCRERRLFTHHPHCPSYTPGNTVVREQATSGGWPSDPGASTTSQAPHSPAVAAAQAAQFTLPAPGAAAPPAPHNWTIPILGFLCHTSQQL